MGGRAQPAGIAALIPGWFQLAEIPSGLLLQVQRGLPLLRIDQNE